MFSICVWVGETRLRGACGRVSYVCLCVCALVTVQASCASVLCFVHASAETLCSLEQRPNLGCASV